MENELWHERGETPAQLPTLVNCGESTLADQQRAQKSNGKKFSSRRKRSEIEKHDDWIDSIEMMEHVVGFELNKPRRLKPRLKAAKLSLEIAWAQWLGELRLSDTLLDVTHLAEQMINAAGLKDWCFEFGDSKKWVGCCNHESKTIKLDRSFVHFEFLKSKKNIREVLLHEIAHAIHSEKPRRWGHDPMWREIAISIGSNGERYLHID